MGNRTANFVSTLVASIIAGAPMAAQSQNAPTASSTANAAADCLASPKGVAPQGQHWYYRLDRATKRQCWYLRAAGDKNGAKGVQAAQAADDSPAAETPPPQQQQRHPVQDARAEYLVPRGGVAPAGAATQVAAAPTPQPSADQTAESAAQQPASPPQPASPWPDVPAASAPAAPQPTPAVAAAAAQPSTKPSKSPSHVAPAAADSQPNDKPGGSLQMLLLVIGGALTLAGILGSLIYRFAGARVRVQAADRQGYWNDWEAQQQGDASRAPWRGTEPSDIPPPRPIDFDAAHPQPTKPVTRPAATGREIHLMDARKLRGPAPPPEPTTRDEGDLKLFKGAFEIVPAAPGLAANESPRADCENRADGKDCAEAPADRAPDMVDVDVITTMLEQLAKEGPRLSRPNLEAEPANFERSPRGRSAARA